MRIRTIKPDFWIDEDLAELSIHSRLTFIGLWNLADAEGIIQGTSKLIKAQIFPYDSFSITEVDTWLNELSDHSKKFIERYTFEGREYIKVTRFTQHQRPDPREKAKGYPQPNNVESLVKQCLNTDKTELEPCANGMDYGVLDTGLLDTGVLDSSTEEKIQNPKEIQKAVTLAENLAKTSTSNQKTSWLKGYLLNSFTVNLPKDLCAAEAYTCWAEACEYWDKGDAYVRKVFSEKLKGFHSRPKQPVNSFKSSTPEPINRDERLENLLQKMLKFRKWVNKYEPEQFLLIEDLEKAGPGTVFHPKHNKIDLPDWIVVESEAISA